MNGFVRRFLPARAGLVLLVVVLALTSAHAGGERVLVIGADGRALDAVVVLVSQELDAGRPVFDARGEGDLKRLDHGILVLEDASALARSRTVLWAEGHAATTLDATASGVRLLAAHPLTGRVRFANGDGAGGREIVAIPVGRGGIVHRTETDEKGAFAFPYVAAGRWALRIRRGEARWQMLGTLQAGDAAAEAILLAAGGQVRGLLLDADAPLRKALPGVPLVLRALPGSAAPAGTSANAETDAEGRFTFLDLPAGIWEASVKEGAPYDLPSPGPRIQVTPGVNSEFPDFSATRRVAIVGRVEDGEGNGVGGARLQLLLAAGQQAPDGLGPLPAGQSDAHGDFRLSGVRPALFYRLALSADGLAPRVLEPFEVGCMTDHVLAPIGLSRGWTLEVRVFAPGGLVLEGVLVRAVPASKPELFSDAFGRIEARSDARGVARLEGLPLDDVRVVAGGGDWLEAEDVATWPRTGETANLSVTLAPAQTLKGRVVMENGLPLPDVEVFAIPRDGSPERHADVDRTGTFEVRGLGGSATDLLVIPSGRGRETPPLAIYERALPGTEGGIRILLPIPRRLFGRAFDLDVDLPSGEIRLEASLPDRKDREVERWQTIRRVPLPEGDPSPRWAIEGLAPGAYAVRLVQGHRDSGPTSIWIDEGDVGGVELTLEEGGGIAGTVLRFDGGVGLGARVFLERLRGDGDRPDGPEDAWVQSCDSDGAYAFEGVAPGLWRVVARDGAAAPDVEEVRVGEGENIVVRDLVVGGGGAIEGRVLDSSGRELDGARLLVESLEWDGVGEWHARTRADGTFRVEDIPAGLARLRLESEAGAYTHLEALVEVVAGETKDVELMPDGRAEVQGTVRRRGEVVSGATLRLVSFGDGVDQGLLRLETRTDDGGAFAWRALASGRYALDVLDGVVQSRKVFFLRDTDRLILDLDVYDARILGRVESMTGRPIVGARVRAFPREPDEEGDVLGARARTDPDGRFVLFGLPEGVYDLEVSAPGLPPGRYEEAHAEKGAAADDVTIVVGRGGILELRVVDETGRGIPEARVWLETLDGRSLTERPYAPTGSGRLRLPGVPEGRWWLRVEARGYGAPPRRPFDAREGITETARVVLGRGSKLIVDVGVEDSDLLPMARVSLLSEADGTVRRAYRSRLGGRLSPLEGLLPRSGRLVLEDLGPGAYRLLIDAGARYERLEIDVDLDEGEDLHLDVRLRPASER